MSAIKSFDGFDLALAVNDGDNQDVLALDAKN